MGDELLLNPRDIGKTFPDPAEKLKTGHVKATSGPAEPRPGAPTAPGASTDKNAWQESDEVKAVIDSLTGRNSEISITLDRDTHQLIVKVLDATTGEVIRRVPLKDPIPPDEGSKKITGLFVDASQ
jgi:uncharacterized FlaG/YvyC family protein